ncbi:MAG: hypothetical protein M1440_14495 [Gammaproteobacteria bacterium]|nr:hypothetical protein [Gammaproteobacteria bacterium]
MHQSLPAWLLLTGAGPLDARDGIYEPPGMGSRRVQHRSAAVAQILKTDLISASSSDSDDTPFSRSRTFSSTLIQLVRQLLHFNQRALAGLVRRDADTDTQVVENLHEQSELEGLRPEALF